MPGPVMVLAAGLGTRMGALTADRPKPLIAVAGRPLIDHALDIAAAAGAGPIVVNTHYRAGMLAGHLAGRGVAISHEPELLDTGGGLKAALPLLGAGPVFTLNSDAVWTGPNPLLTLAAAWREACAALLLFVPGEQARGRLGPGDATLLPGGRVGWGGEMVFTGAQLVRTEALAAIPEAAFPMRRLWDAAEAEGRLFGVVHAGGWCDVGHPGGIAEAEAMLAEAAR